MSVPDRAPVALSAKTAGALAVAHAWGRAFSERDLDRLLAPSAATVLVQALIELRSADSGEPAETTQAVAPFDMRDGQITAFRPLPDLACALRSAGWTGQTRPNTASLPGGSNHERRHDA